MPRMQALLGTCSLLGLAAGQSLSLSDSVSVVQGLVHAHQHAEGQSQQQLSGCEALTGEEAKETVDPALAAKAELVVIRGGGEDVRWLDALSEIPAVLYNRNGLEELLPKPRGNLQIVKQENTGREDEAMLRHIISNYDKLPEVTMFLQGWPFWHCAGTIETVRRAVRNAQKPVDPDFVGSGALSGLVPLAGSFYQYAVKEGYLGNWKNLLIAHHNKYKLKLEEASKLAVRTYNSTCSEILGRPCPNEHWVSEGAQWAVSRERIRSQPVSFYQRLLDMDVPANVPVKERLRGLVLEAVWPVIWGAQDWTPGSMAKVAVKGKVSAAVKRVDAMGDYCSFGTDKGPYPSSAERRGVCELEKHASGMPAYGAVNMASESSRWTPTVALRAILGHSIRRGDAELGSSKKEATRPKKTYTSEDFRGQCAKRHIWPPSVVTRLKNRETGKCVEHSAAGFRAADCQGEAEGQQLRLISNGNGGHFQILDKTETACLTHGFAQGAPTTCTMGPDGGAPDHQRWSLLKQDNGTYHIKMKAGEWCIVHAGGRLQIAGCDSHAAYWELSDAEAMGQYWDKFEWAITQLADGKLKLRCVAKLKSYSDETIPDLVEPDWRKRGLLMSFQLSDAPEGGYYLAKRGATGEERYLSCNDRLDAVMGTSKMAWRINPVSDGFVFLQSGERVLQFGLDSGSVLCGHVPDDGLPPPDTTFAMEFQQQGPRTI